jgi:hypothetical protein
MRARVASHPRPLDQRVSCLETATSALSASALFSETEGKTPHKAKGQPLAGGDGLLLAVAQFGEAWAPA